ncbi:MULTISPECIES: methyltransferase domain-containing protein [Thermodesulfovibrio]|jgi:malonyl-CoA O-methyltransferase|uniref:methyltransferase domain-containing protein n=1 Tax=Thermodesulfovibrio TaxID=28261 RepID=UPI0026303584|nr:methyltransferase domain-containing protein [Thermodesulfovibrio sp.]
MKDIKFYFNKAANTYESYASIQKQVALELTKNIQFGIYPKVVEIGSGSGIIMTILSDKINFQKFIHVDISFEFLKKMKNNTDSSHYLINARAEEIPLKNQIADLLISSSALHWLSNPKSNFSELLRILKKGGKFYFSIFTSQTLKEIEQVSKITGFGSVYELKEADFYLSIFKDIDIPIKYKILKYKQKYSSVRELFLSHKLTGTNFTEKKKFSGKQSFQNFCRLYNKLFGNSDGIYATYEVLFIEGQI